MSPARFFLFKKTVIKKLKASTESLWNLMSAQRLKSLYMCPSFTLTLLQIVKGGRQ